ncbi:MAG: hypothetical protein LIP04_16550 [Tannerellaceae bacterium]|nr:hypothetical protein [Tannerellaceae bacterium]
MSETINELNTTQLWDTYELSALEAKKKKYQEIANDQRKSEQERKKALEEIKGLETQIAGITQNQVRLKKQSATEVFNMALAQQGFNRYLSDAQIYDVVKLSGSKENLQLAKQYQTLMAKANGAVAKDTVTTTSPTTGISVTQTIPYSESEKEHFRQMVQDLQNQFDSPIYIDAILALSEAPDGPDSMLARYVNMTGEVNRSTEALQTQQGSQQEVFKAVEDTVTAQQGSLVWLQQQYGLAVHLRDSYERGTREWENQVQVVRDLASELERVERITELLHSNSLAQIIEPGAIQGIETSRTGIEKINADLQQFAGSVESQEAQTGFWENMGSVFTDLWGSSAEVGKLFNTSAQAIQQFAGDSEAGAIAANSMMLAQQGLAIATGVAQAVMLPFPANIPAIATTIAAITSAFSVIGSFATGGIVGGGSYTGDHLLARVNSGEMILNKAQQSNLFHMVSGGMNYTGSPQMVVLSTRLRGKDIEISGNNYRKIQSKLG